jgi:two-component system NtrC family sensor kinase
MASFYVIRGKDNGQHFPIRGPLATIGRDALNPIRLRDTEVSRNHAQVMRTADAGHEIVDNGSSNGTYVNSRRIDRKILQSGDRVQVGRTLMIYTGGPEPHTSRSSGQVEIVAQSQPSDLSHIRSSLDSYQIVTNSRLDAPSVIPSGRQVRGASEGRDLESKQRPTDSEPSVEASSLPANSTSELPPRPLGRDNPSTSDDSASGGLSSSDWEIVYRVGQAISRTGDLDDLLTQVLELIFQWIACDRGCILMVDDVTGQLMPSHSRDAKQQVTSGGKSKRPLRISRTILDHVVSTREGVLTSNAQDDARWENVASIADLGIQEAICVPMLGRYGLVGAIYVDTALSAGLYAERRGQSLFDEQHLKLMVAIAGQAALAIEDTQFYRAMLQSERLAAMGQTIANLSHHVKNILQGVRGGAYLVDDGLRKEDLAVIRKGWGIVERNQERISNLVMDMLSFSKDREPDLMRGDVRQVIDDVLELMQVRAAELAVEFVWDPPVDPLMVDFDGEAMHRAVLNVVTNAIDAVSQAQRSNQGSSEQGTGKVSVVVELSQLKNRVRIDIADNGPGIPEEEQARIFSPFESNKGARGTGLGLPVSQKILREHGGDIEVQSQAGSGTIFTLYWPAYREPSPNGSPTYISDAPA